MTNRPIIFSAPMVRAILDGRKSQTRRMLKPKRGVKFSETVPTGRKHGLGEWREVPLDKLSVPYTVGERLWVKEAWRTAAAVDDLPPRYLVPGLRPVSYDADYKQEPNDGCRGRLRSPIHMPRWASRITLEVTEVRVQRLQDISEEDAEAEGCEEGYCTVDGIAEGWSAKSDFERLWNSIHGPGAWEANPWVAEITFKRAEGGNG